MTRFAAALTVFGLPRRARFPAALSARGFATFLRAGARAVLRRALALRRDFFFTAMELSFRARIGLGSALGAAGCLKLNPRHSVWPSCSPRADNRAPAKSYMRLSKRHTPAAGRKVQ